MNRMLHRNHDNDIDIAAFRRFAMLQRQNHIHVADPALRRVIYVKLKEPRVERISVVGNILSYNGQDDGRVGVYLGAEPLTRFKNYFEVEIIETGVSGSIGVGVVPIRYPLDCMPGWNPDSVGYHADDGKLFKSNAHGRQFGPRCNVGDRIGCGVTFHQPAANDEGAAAHQLVPVFFTRNGREVGTVLTMMPAEGLHPAVGMQSEGEEVRINFDARWEHSDVILMSIDSCEEDWSRLHDVKINGQMLEYVGRGKSIIDVGLAQARHPLTTRYHYFEIQIIDPGENCYIAIGLARRDYPKHRHPGWNKGSVAYHADDGKVFIGSGVGEKFGPECNKGDTMGCGILFPRDYRRDWDAPDDSLEGAELSDGSGKVEYVERQHEAGFTSSESEDEEWWQKPYAENGTKVQVFFTRNGKTVGKREVRIPRGGFYPTVGMLSSDEKVRVDLRPLTG